jgi:hypothetical protein
MLAINYLDVADGYSGYADNPSSAYDLMLMIQAMQVSGFAGGGDLLTAKADLLSHNGTTDEILPGGANEYILSRDNTESTGLKWIAKSAVVSGTLTSTDTSYIDTTISGVNITVDATSKVKAAVNVFNFQNFK